MCLGAEAAAAEQPTPISQQIKETVTSAEEKVMQIVSMGLRWIMDRFRR